MKKKTLAIAGAAGVLGLGLAIPAVALADPSPGPSTTSGAPDDHAQRHTQRRAQLAEALAKELGIPQEKVAAALEKVDTQLQDQAKQERQAALKARLDQAVKDGKLTQEQAGAILKAAESGVLPGGGPGGHGPGRGFRGPR